MVPFSFEALSQLYFISESLLETNIPSTGTQNTSFREIPMSYFSLSAKSHLKLHYTLNGRGILRRYALSRIRRTKGVNDSCTWLITFRGGRIYIYACSRCSSSGKYWEMSVRPMWTTQIQILYYFVVILESWNIHTREDFYMQRESTCREKGGGLRVQSDSSWCS